MVKPKKLDHLLLVCNFSFKAGKCSSEAFSVFYKYFCRFLPLFMFWGKLGVFFSVVLFCMFFWQIVYVAPVKALAAEMTANFGNKLQPLGIVVRELTGDMQLTKKEIQETQVQCKDSMSSTQPINFYLNFPGRLAQLLVVFPVEKCVLKSQQ